jgi:hypothetical protein
MEMQFAILSVAQSTHSSSSRSILNCFYDRPFFYLISLRSRGKRKRKKQRHGRYKRHNCAEAASVPGMHQTETCAFSSTIMVFCWLKFEICDAEAAEADRGQVPTAHHSLPHPFRPVTHWISAPGVFEDSIVQLPSRQGHRWPVHPAH